MGCLGSHPPIISLNNTKHISIKCTETVGPNDCCDCCNICTKFNCTIINDTRSKENIFFNICKFLKFEKDYLKNHKDD